MDFIDVTVDNNLARLLKGPLFFFNFGSIMLHHWKSDVLSEDKENDPNSEKTHVKNKICFTVDDDYIELSNSVIEEEPEVQLMPSIGGEAKTLGLSIKFNIANVLIVGKICILNDSNSLITSEYELRLEDVDITTIFGFWINDEIYDIDDIKHEFQKANVSLTYKDGSQVISILDKVTDSRTKHLLESYIVHKCTKEILEAIQNVFLQHLYDTGGSVTEYLGNNLSLRNTFRHHEKRLKIIFIMITDKMLEMTNETIKQKTPNISLPKLFEVITSKGDPKSVKIYNGLINIVDSLERVKTPIIYLENELVILYISVNLSKIQVTYEKGRRTNQEFFKTIDSYLKLSINKLNTRKAEINSLDFKIKGFKSLSESHLILDYLESSLVEEKIKEYFTETLKNKDINKIAPIPAVWQ